LSEGDSGDRKGEHYQTNNFGSEFQFGQREEAKYPIWFSETLLKLKASTIVTKYRK
jgi:hypothetical protein